MRILSCGQSTVPRVCDRDDAMIRLWRSDEGLRGRGNPSSLETAGERRLLVTYARPGCGTAFPWRPRRGDDLPASSRNLATAIGICLGLRRARGFLESNLLVDTM